MFVQKHVLMNNEPSQGGGGPDDLQAQLETMKSQLTEQNNEIERLRGHSAKLLDEKKQLQNQYKAFEGLGDPDTLKNMLKQFENDEDAKLVAEGKFNDVLNRHTQKLSLDFTTKIDDLSGKLEQTEKISSKYKDLYHQSEAGHALRSAAVAAGVEETAVDDVLLRGRGLFTVSDDGTLEARDSEGNLRVINGKALTPELYVESLRDKYPHYWPKSQSSGARGGAGGDSMPNPFVKGPNYNLTEQSKLMTANPELAKRLQAEAKAGAT